MSVIRLFLYGLLALLAGGCGQTVTETLHIPDTAPARAVCETDKTVVALPFADYTGADDLASVRQRSLAVMESLTDRLVAKGFRMPVQEDVFQYLVDQGIITVVSSESGEMKQPALDYEMAGEWSQQMKGMLSEVAASEEMRTSSADDPRSGPGAHGLDRKSVQDLGKRFNADYVVRGRLIAYDLRREHTWEVKKIGLLPFVYNGASRSLFGIARSETYDNLDAIALGALAGGLIGYEADSPYEPATTLTTISGSTTTTVSTGTEDAASKNAWLWGAVGAGAAHLAKNGGDTPQAVVQLRVWVQDASTGEVVWTNRAEVAVAPESIFGDTRTRALLDTAVDRAVTALVDDFWAKNKARM